MSSGQLMKSRLSRDKFGVILGAVPRSRNPRSSIQSEVNAVSKKEKLNGGAPPIIVEVWPVWGNDLGLGNFSRADIFGHAACRAPTTCLCYPWATKAIHKLKKTLASLSGKLYVTKRYIIGHY